MRHKSEAFEMFKLYRNEVEKQTEKSIKTLRSDRGGEYLSNEFLTYLGENGILSQWTPPGTPQYNGVSERRNRTLLDMVRSMMGFASLPISFWGYALESACYILNKVPSKSVNKTPHEMWTGRKPMLSHLRVWGCPAYVKRLKTDKLEPKSDKCFFVGYPKETKGYYFYFAEEQKLFVSNRAVFLEKEFLSEGTKSSNVELREVQHVEDPTPSTELVESDLIRSDPKPILDAPLRRSGRVPRQPDRYYDFLVRDPVELDENDEDPITYMAAIQRHHSDASLGAMQAEIESMKVNDVWTLVDPPEGIKPIGCKWIFKRKRGADGKTTTAINLSSILAKKGKKTLLIDADPQGNATSGLGVSKDCQFSTYDILINDVEIINAIQQCDIKNLDLCPTNLSLAGAEVELVNSMGREYRLKEKIDNARENYDYIIIDCPPSLGLITLNALTASDSVLIPVQCEYFALEGVGELLKTVDLVRKYYNKNLTVEGALLTMYDPRTKLSNQVVEQVQKFFENRVFETLIPRNVRLSEAPSYGEPISSYDPFSKGGRAYDKLVKEFLKKNEN